MYNLKRRMRAFENAEYNFLKAQAKLITEKRELIVQTEQNIVEIHAKSLQILRDFFGTIYMENSCVSVVDTDELLNYMRGAPAKTLSETVYMKYSMKANTETDTYILVTFFLNKVVIWAEGKERELETDGIAFGSWSPNHLTFTFTDYTTLLIKKEYVLKMRN